MQASTPDQLRRLLAAEPETSPSTFLKDDSFAAWCYDHRSLRELRSAFQRDADPDECEKWHLTPLEWRAQIEMALVALATAKRRSETS